MTRSRDHSCARCGLPVYTRGAICTDCRAADRVYVAMVSR